MQQKLYRFEVDQSVRIEELNRPSIVGLANTEDSISIKLNIRTKRQLHEHFRRLGQPKRFAPKVFAGIIVFAIKNYNKDISELLIDIEYPGYEILISQILKKHFPELLVYFGVIGKKSPAHYVAYGVHKGNKEVDLILKNFKEILKLI